MNRRSRLRATLLVALSVVPAVGTWVWSALAQEDVQRAKNDFEAGAAAYDKGLYDIALQAFTQAYSEAKRPAILFSIAQTERRLYTMGHDVSLLRSAIGHYHEYLAQVPEGGRRDDAVNALQDLEPDLARLPPGPAPATMPGPDGGMVVVPPPVLPPAAPAKPKTMIAYRSDTPGAMVSIDGAPPSAGMQALSNPSPGPHRVHIGADGYVDFDTTMQAIPDQLLAQEKDLTEKPGQLFVQTESGADITVDGRLLATTPLVQPLDLSPGAHYVVVTKNGKKAVSRAVTLVHGHRVDVAVGLESSGQRIAADALLIGGGAVILAGGAFTGVALVEQSRAEDILNKKAMTNLTSSDLVAYGNDVDLRDTWKTVAMITYGGGLALLATGTLLYLFDKPSAESAAPPDAAPRGPSPSPAPATHPEMEMGAAPILGPGLFGIGAAGRF